MNKNIIIAIIAVLVLVGGTYYYLTTKNVVDESKPHEDATPHATETTNPNDGMAGMENGQMNMMGPGSKEAGTRVIIKNSSLKSGTQELSFQVYGTDGDSWGDKDLKIAHEKKMHFIVVSNNFSDYQHIHPSFSNETWKVNLDLKDKTGYHAYVDVDSNELGTEVLRFPLSVGSVINSSKISQNEKTVTKNSITTTITGIDTLVTGKVNTVTFALTSGVKSITPEKYLGAKGHVVALTNDPNIFIHGHPSEDADVKEVHFEFNFQKEGTYTLFAQFQVNGKVETYPFTVNVKSGGSTSSTTDESKPHEDATPHN